MDTRHADAPTVPPDACTDRHLVFLVLAASQIVFVLQFGMVAVALQDLTTDLRAPLRWSGWVLTMFQLGHVIALPLAGHLSDRFGTRRVLVGGLLVFAAASAGCAFAPNVYFLILCRVLQGAAGGGLGPAGASLLGEVYGAARLRAIGFYASLGPLGAILGPVVGGLLVEHGGWRWTFALNAPMALAVALLGMLLFPRGARRAAGPTDLPGVALIAIVVTSLVFALTELGRRDGVPSLPLVIGAFAAFAVSLGVLTRHERRAVTPVIDLDLLLRREFFCLNTIAFLFGAAWVGLSVMVPLFVQTVYGMSPAESGVITAPRSILMVISSSVWTWLLPRTGFRRPLVIGFIGYAGALTLVSMGLRDPVILGVPIATFWWAMGSVALGGVFFGLINPAMHNAGLDLAPDRIAAVAGLRGMFSVLGSTLGITVIVLIASRADDIGEGLRIGFVLMAVVILLATAFIAGVPAAPSGERRADRV